MKIVENRRKFILLSLIVILCGLGAMVYHAMQGEGIFNWDVEFTGGTAMEIDLGEAYEAEALEEIIAEATGQTSPQIQQILGTDAIELKLQSIGSETREALVEAIRAAYPAAELIEANDISGTVSREMQRNAIKATLIACVAMLLYISVRFRDFRAGSSAILALLHDVLIVLAAYAILRIPVNQSFIAVLLTILGYSVNATIVIFDRVRENRENFPAGQAAERINRSIGQTLKRNINTTLTTLFTVGAIYFLGVSSIKEFALPMMIGMIAGAYSSIFISGSLWYLLLPRAEKEA